MRRPPGPDWEHSALFERVREAIFAVPGAFRSNVVIRGVLATDLFHLNALLSAAIEEGVVQALNSLRQVWDSQERYAMYAFVRQPQTFPDVRLQNTADPSDILLGIELKGWYLLAKEAEPSFRFLTTPHACAPADLFVVYPWHLAEVIAGVPQLMSPHVDLARYVAEYRNHHWEFVMHHRKSSKVILSATTRPYPTKMDEIADAPEADRGGNFGRIARTGILDDFVNRAGNHLLSGIPARHWRSFLRMFTETATPESMEAAMTQFGDRLAKASRQEVDLGALRNALDQLVRTLRPPGGGTTA